MMVVAGGKVESLGRPMGNLAVQVKAKSGRPTLPAGRASAVVSSCDRTLTAVTQHKPYEAFLMRTIGQVLDQNKGLGPGFDFLRISLASLIVLMHSFYLLKHDGINNTPFWFAGYGLVPMFFALSGFLVCGSAQRLSLKNFLINRGLRIIPALSVDTLVCALIIGPLVTTLALRHYFTDPKFFLYLFNVTGYIHFRLPGVFETHPERLVNGALWTVPFEISCYFVMSFFIITGWVRRPALVFGSMLAWLFVGLATEVIYRQAAHPGFALRALNYFLVYRGAQLIATFIMGIFVYQMRARIPYSWALFWGCIGICLVGSLTLGASDIDQVGNRFLLLPALVYITVFLGLTKIPLPDFLHKGDYSYGVYLYHDPFLQIIISLFPALVAMKFWGSIGLFALGFPVSLGVAYLSWNLIEKPILALRKKFSFVAKVRGVEDAPADIPGLPEESRGTA
jgi:peptidoglycan/LPS O-acetylase OafA/YrhL